MTTPLTLNTIKLIRLEEEIIGLGWNQKHKPKQNFCSYVAEKTGEIGEDSPSDKAIKFAERVVARYKGMRTHANSS
jgi:hypothetical protein